MATIRINDDDKKKLDKICREANLSHPEIFHLAIAAFEKQRLSKRLKLDFEVLALNETALDEYKIESHIFDHASSDGLLE
jgi:predicted transcriptional regulator